jgi:ribulose-phosphate 3-epimerase
MPVYPTILTEDEEVLQQQLNLCQDMPDLTAVQIDLIDGEFVDHQTIKLQAVVEAEKYELPLDFHLMVNEPMDTVWELIEWKDQLNIRTVIAQIERMSYPLDYISELKKHHWRVGLALDIYTPWEEIDPAWLMDVDMIQLLGGPAGIQGQPLHDQIWPKIQAVATTLNQFYNSPAFKTAAVKQPIEIAVDVGVTLETAPKLIKAGVTGLATGHQLWQASDPIEAFKELTALLPATESD